MVDMLVHITLITITRFALGSKRVRACMTLDTSERHSAGEQASAHR